MKKTANKSKAKSTTKVAGKKPVRKVAPKKSGVRAAAGDIITLILEDHKPLKRLIKIMKSDKPLSERKAAYKEFVPLLVAHAKPEEQTWYVAMKQDEDMREHAFEGDVEHQLADQMAEEAERAEDGDLYGARIKVLAELVEHHIKEEEEEMLPEYRKNSESEDRVALGEKYLQLKAQIEAEGSDDSPSEKKLKRSDQMYA
jgi:hypothetical protein